MNIANKTADIVKAIIIAIFGILIIGAILKAI